MKIIKIISTLSIGLFLILGGFLWTNTYGRQFNLSQLGYCTVTIGIISLLLFAYKLRSRKISILLLLSALELVLFIFYASIYVECEPCITKEKCPPCLSSQQKNIFWTGLILLICYLNILLFRQPWLDKLLKR